MVRSERQQTYEGEKSAKNEPKGPVGRSMAFLLPLQVFVKRRADHRSSVAP